MRRWLFISVVSLLGVASVAVAQVPPELQPSAESAARVYAEPFSLFHVPSSGAVADTTFIAISASKGPSRIAKQLAKILAPGASTPIAVAVAGPSEAKTVQVLADALKVAGEKAPLEMLTVIYVGTPAFSRQVEPNVFSSGARFVFAPL